MSLADGSIDLIASEQRSIVRACSESRNIANLTHLLISISRPVRRYRSRPSTDSYPPVCRTQQRRHISGNLLEERLPA